MKKFKKPLIINVPQDDHNETKSPSRIGPKQNKQKSLLLFNQQTISSSVNNEDDLLQQDEKAIQLCDEFTEYNNKREYNKKDNSSLYQEQQAKNHKLQRHKKFNIIQFEQFMVQGDEKFTQVQNDSAQSKQKRLFHNYHKKQFSIQIPEEQKKYQSKQESHQMSIKFGFDLKNNQLALKNKKYQKQNVIKQPPAPSNKISQGKSQSRRFVFPTNDEGEMSIYHQNNFGSKDQKSNNKQKTSQKRLNASQKQLNTSQKQLNNGYLISEQVHQSIIKQHKQMIQQMNKSFQKQRQQFYKQKSRLQKDLMIRDGQIQMLQRLITNRYSPTNNNINQEQINTNNNNYGDNYVDTTLKNTKRQLLSQSITIERSKLFYVSDQKITTMETLLLEKDLQINSLLEKINQLNSLIDQKNNQLQQLKIGFMKTQKINQSLRNQIFIHQKKEQSQKITKQFYKVKQNLIQVQKSTKTPKASNSRPKWQQESSLQNDKQFQKTDYPFRGIDDLHKRLESLKMNRIQLQSRGRIKSEMNYPQTSKSKVKTTFDFKGKFYDRQRNYNLRGAPY